MDEGLWITSVNEESWSSYANSYSTKEEAVAHAVEDLDLAPGDNFWVGQICSPVIDVSADSFLNDVREMLCDQVGEHGEEWPDCTDEQLDELEKQLRNVFFAWMDKHNLRPRCFTVEHAEQEVVEGDVVGEVA